MPVQAAAAGGLTKRYWLAWSDESEATALTLSELLDANPDTFSDDKISDLRDARNGEQFWFGGGAAPECVITVQWL
jgi:hypothetical protein